MMPDWIPLDLDNDEWLTPWYNDSGEFGENLTEGDDDEP
jgi:hypothetical protein